ncbi:MAG: hypothetical protein M0R06_07445 [Sphaerochaeta sp.]|nr:hypothetical protein [Sphaerochaeta sp.]
MIDPTDAKEDEYVMTLDDALILQEILEHFKSFSELRKAVGKKLKDERPVVRHDFMECVTIPCNGSNYDTFVGVLNVFGDFSEDNNDALEGVRIQPRLDFKYLVAKLSGELNVSEIVAKRRLRTLINGKWLEQSGGVVLFPIKYWKE